MYYYRLRHAEHNIIRIRKLYYFYFFFLERNNNNNNNNTLIYFKFVVPMRVIVFAYIKHNIASI